MTKRPPVLVALLTAALVTACSTAAPAPTPTSAPAAPTKAAAPTTVAAPTAAPAAQAPAASNYPNRPITWIVPYSAGQGPDLASRFIAGEMEKDLGQKIVVEDKPGGGTVIGMGELATAKPDGYTIGWAGLWSLDYLPLIQEVPFKGSADFTLLANVHNANGVVTVKADSQWKTMQDLFDDAKKRPGKISLGVMAGLKSLGHLQALQIAKAGGVTFNILPLNVSGVPDVLGGTLDVVLEGTSTIVPQIKAGKVRGLFVHYENANLPGLPNAKTFGFKVTPAYGAVLGPKGLPPDAVSRLSASLKKILTSQAFLDFEQKINYDPSYMGPEELAKEAALIAAASKAIATEQGWLLKK